MTLRYVTLTDDHAAINRMEAEPFTSARQVYAIRADAHLSAGASMPSPNPAGTPSAHPNEAGCAPTCGLVSMADYMVAACGVGICMIALILDAAGVL